MSSYQNEQAEEGCHHGNGYGGMRRACHYHRDELIRGENMAYNEDPYERNVMSPIARAKFAVQLTNTIPTSNPQTRAYLTSAAVVGTGVYLASRGMLTRRFGNI
jgi:hypothetical protein